MKGAINMQTQIIDKVLDDFFSFPIEEQEFIIDILNKRMIEEKRNLIVKDYKKAVKNYKMGKVKKGSVDDLFADIK